ncbi:rhodanese-like domain-containing protein [Fulvivirga sp. RKSG066]|uniref:rhodanese-like domain-containing protein n=1 Tax=Fulvivirga aurantia TaxID=2529383 RepID=UPI0012BC9CA4|nr:rhodanese-like domain-containing protein [Fulvivirga aurantia]MTI21499.1 rhodanese-like domain-containing protein [Fulvivirga aurantia]
MFGLLKKSKHKNIDSATFRELMSQPDVQILDVRTPAEVFAGAIPNHLNINLMSFDFTNKVKALDRDKTYLVYCRSGARSARACKKMSKIGFENLYNLSGGIIGWNNA